MASIHAHTRLLQVPYFSAVNLDEMEALLRTRLGFTDDDISQAYANAKARTRADAFARAANARRPPPTRTVYYSAYVGGPALPIRVQGEGRLRQ